MRESHQEQSVYVHSYILQSLSGVCVASPLMKIIINGAAQYLKSAQGNSGWWRFYGPDMEEPPDDADDTSVALAALLSSTRPFDVRTRKEANSWLDSLERLRSESGLYKTWADASWNEECFELPDLIVNANVLFLQTILERPDRRVSEYLARVVQTETYQVLNLYGVATYAAPFLISRCYYHGAVGLRSCVTKLKEYILSRQERDGGWGSDLDSVLALLTVINSGYAGDEVCRAAEFLRDRQQADGGWEPGALFRDLCPRYYGSGSLTTAFCIEALARLSAIVTSKLRLSGKP